MSEAEIAYCHACKAAMDVSAVEPFSNVECPACGEATRVKREFGPYTLSRRHAIGGMSLVFVADDATLGREVIVKILNKEYSADKKRISAFEEEARITASFSHPNVVRVFTTGRAFDRFYIAMEFVRGGHFEQHITDRGMIPEAEALKLAMDVASGLKAAKTAGLIHRDVKPGNILIDSNGQAKLVDFGLALVTKGGKATASEIWATPYYVPPETIEGQEEDFRSDMYAFGATMYHALAGRPPCNEESMDTKRLRAAKQQVQPLRKAAGWLHPETCVVIDRCMAYSPDDRYRSYNALSSALHSAMKSAGKGVPPPPQTTSAVPKKASRRTQRSLGQKLALASAVLVVLVAIAFGAKVVIGSPGPVAPAGPFPTDTGSAGGSTDSTSSSIPDGGADLEVIKLYRAATDALGKGMFVEARNGFRAVRDHPGVLEPTGTCAAAEAVVAAYLDGDSDGARAELRKARRHLFKAKGLQKGLAARFDQSITDLLGFAPILYQGDGSTKGHEDALILMMSGLKNWDQGRMDQAVPFFRDLASRKARHSPAWANPYVKWSRVYLGDATQLSHAEPATFDLQPETARSLADEMQGVYDRLQTKGRARFNVRFWQIQLERQARRSAPPESVKPERRQGILREPEALAARVKACQFEEASQMLRQWRPEDRMARERKRIYTQLIQASQTFLAEIGESAQGTEAELPIRTRDGRDYVKVVGGSVHRLRVESSSGKVDELEWLEIEPESLISLHRELLKSQGEHLDSLRRHEHAVSFDFLAGDRSRAVEAAERLGKVSELFARRWELVKVVFGDE